MIVYVMLFSRKSVLKFRVPLPVKSLTDNANNMTEMNLKFDDLPKAISWMMNKLKELDSKLDGITSQPKEEPEDQWLNLKELCSYLPSHPAEQTVYGWTSCHQIPFHKKGKRIMFLKSEIDTWLHESKIKSPKAICRQHEWRILQIFLHRADRRERCSGHAE